MESGTEDMESEIEGEKPRINAFQNFAASHIQPAPSVPSGSDNSDVIDDTDMADTGEEGGGIGGRGGAVDPYTESEAGSEAHNNYNDPQYYNQPSNYNNSYIYTNTAADPV